MCETKTPDDVRLTDGSPDDEWADLRHELNDALQGQAVSPLPAALPDAAWTRSRRRAADSPRRRRKDAAPVPAPSVPAPPADPPPTDRLAVKTERLERDTVVSATGDVDAATAPILRQALYAATGGADSLELVAVDLRAACLCDEAVWPALIEAHQRLALQGRRLFVIVTPDSPASQRLTALGLDTLLTQIATPRELRWMG